ncbi:C4-type zinc ribbon domain-containing protein [Pseudokineococcus sp. 5B2Z-1]|uniref:zinc ribbon domain-containing protein n=1 Tax=Pseudokineococcus sp. 5B2Z-1 TaxID=3132744 RepID=UPI003096A5B7
MADPHHPGAPPSGAAAPPTGRTGPLTTTAPARDQLRLLDVQALDTRLSQLAHRRRTLPERTALAEREQRAAGLRDDVVRARTAASDVEREVARAEKDVDLVRQRAARNQQRLDSGAVSAKDAAALVSELESLARRQSALEEVELEVMERQEVAQTSLVGLEQLLAEVDAEAEQAREALRTAVTEIDRDVESVRADRERVAGGVSDELLAVYEESRREHGGMGAAPLRARRCEGCRMEQNTVALGRLRSAPEDAVLRCEECDRILVRTPESGL